MKLSKFILNNVKRIQENPLNKLRFIPYYVHFNEGKLICGAGYIRVLEGRSNKKLKPRDIALDFCRKGNWIKACHYLKIDSTPLRLKFNYVLPPEYSEFLGWKEFALHINSLKERALELKEKGL